PTAAADLGSSTDTLLGDLTHLLINSIWLLAFGSSIARRIDSVCFLLFFSWREWPVHSSTFPSIGPCWSPSCVLPSASRDGERVPRRQKQEQFRSIEFGGFEFGGWPNHEFVTLSILHAAGAAAPRPVSVISRGLVTGAV